jgi:hypothetical protein
MLETKRVSTGNITLHCGHWRHYCVVQIPINIFKTVDIIACRPVAK